MLAQRRLLCVRRIVCLNGCIVSLLRGCVGALVCLHVDYFSLPWRRLAPILSLWLEGKTV